MPRPLPVADLERDVALQFVQIGTVRRSPAAARARATATSTSTSSGDLATSSSASGSASAGRCTASKLFTSPSAAAALAPSSVRASR